MLKWKDLLVICKVLAIKVLGTVRVAGASELLDMCAFACILHGLAIKVLGTVRAAGASELLEKGQFCR